MSGYLPDFAVTVVKEEGQEQEEWIYYERLTELNTP